MMCTNEQRPSSAWRSSSSSPLQCAWPPHRMLFPRHRRRRRRCLRLPLRVMTSLKSSSSPNKMHHRLQHLRHILCRWRIHLRCWQIYLRHCYCRFKLSHASRQSHWSCSHLPRRRLVPFRRFRRLRFSHFRPWRDPACLLTCTLPLLHHARLLLVSSRSRRHHLQAPLLQQCHQSLRTHPHAPPTRRPRRCYHLGHHRSHHLRHRLRHHLSHHPRQCHHPRHHSCRHHHHYRRALRSLLERPSVLHRRHHRHHRHEHHRLR